MNSGLCFGERALVAEILSELIDALQAADEQPLEVQLGCDPQVEVAVERVVMRRERPRERAAVEGLQDRRLDLDEALPVEVGADRGDDLRAGNERLACIGACDQVELAAAIAGLDVVQPVVLVRRRAQRLGEDLEAVDTQRQLAAAAAQDGAVDADEVAEIERGQARERVLAEHVDARVQLHLAGAVDEVEERRLARATPRGDPAGDAVFVLGLLAGGRCS